MNRIFFLSVLFLVFSFQGCKEDDDKSSESAIGSFLLGSNINEIVNGSLNQSGTRNSLTLNMQSGAYLLLEFQGDEEKVHAITNADLPRISFITATGDLYESFEGIIQITKFESGGNNTLTIEGIFESRLQSAISGSFVQLQNGNFTFSKS